MEKPKLVYIVSRFPFPLEKGDKLRAYYHLKELSRSFNVTLIAISNKQIAEAHIKEINSYCQEIFTIRLSSWSIFWNILYAFISNLPLQVGYFHSFSGRRKVNKILEQIQPDQIYCQLIRCAEYVKNYHSCPKTLDYMDALSKGIERRITKVSPIFRWIFKMENKRLVNYERTIFEYFENKIIISNQDREYILHPDKKNILCVPNGIDAHFFESLSIKKEFDLVFVGNLSYAPNVEAVQFIVNEIMPKLPDLNCLISGANPNQAVKSFCDQSQNVQLIGWVDDIRESYQSGKIFIAPMMIGTGMQNKLLEAMASGLPCITTSLTNNAIKAKNGEEIIVANTAEEMIHQIEHLRKDPNFNEKIAQSGKSFVQKTYTWHSTSQILINRMLDKIN